MRSPWLKACLLLCAAIPTACTVDGNVGADRDAASSGDAGEDAHLPTDGAPSSDATDGGPSLADASDGPSSTDTSTDGIVGQDAGCGVAFAQEGAWIDVEIVQQVIPPGAGGTIVPGTYALTAMRSYLSGLMGTAQVRETIIVTGSPSVGALARLSEERNTTGDFTSHPPRGDSETFQADTGTTAIFHTPTCGGGFPTGGNYSATATTFTLLDGDRPLERVYARVH